MKSLASSLPQHWPEPVRAILAQHARLDSIFPRQHPVRDWDPASICAITPDLSGREFLDSECLGMLHCLLFYAVDALDEAHALFQGIDSFLGAYGHGMMHRREGDFSNANYWFRHAGPPPDGMFAPGFAPVELTADCQKAAACADLKRERVVEALRCEWVAVVDVVLTRGSFS